jgi:hypothetical protein
MLFLGESEVVMASLSWRVVLFVLTFGQALAAADAPKPVTATDERHFVAKVLPVLQSKCLVCHGNEPAKLKGGFDLRTRAAMLKGGASGKPAVAPGKPTESPLYLAASRQAPEWRPMPPKANDKLSEQEVSALKEWIAAGAPWPSPARIAELARTPAWDGKDGVEVKTSGGLSAEWTNRKYRPEDLWSYRALRKPDVPKADDAANPIDAFLAAKRKALGLTAAPPADRRTLLRRVTFDLTGLPPTTAEIDDFLADKDDEDRAFARVVDRLLASPHYGERMAQHWLDVVRYADSAGFANDYERGPAWRYRDYVVRSFNTDKPYDRFVKEQLAGDEIDSTNPELLVAVGFLRMGPWELTGMEVPRIARQRFLDDVTESVGQTFLAQPIQCARCHDHKFDPIPTRDYYAIQAVFATTQLADRDAPFLKEENRAGFEERAYLEQRRRRYEEELNRLQTAEDAARRAWERDHPRDAGKKPERHQYLSPLELGLERITRKGLERIRWQLDRYEPFALSVYSGRTPALKAALAPMRLPTDREKGELEATTILAGGDPFSPKAAVTPAVLSAVPAGRSTIPTTIDGRRKAFAEWVAAPSNPFTARVMVNRIWGWHFGTPLAGNPNNFGATGKKPTHPELLDWLAATFVEQKWSVKSMHRLLLTSAAYRRSARHPEPKRLAQLDPHGTNYAAFTPRRLSAEEIRDAMLASTGELNRQLGGIPCRPEMNAEAAFQPRQVMGTFAEAWQPNPKPAQRHRRSLYTLKLRGLRDPFFAVFDRPAPESSCELRTSSTLAPQAFTLFNSESSFARALALADAARKEAKSEADAIRAVFRRTLGRAPSADESKVCLAHWQSMTLRHGKLTFARRTVPTEITREAVEENTGEKFRFTERLEMMTDFVSDLQPADCSAEVRGLAEVCLVLFNSNEFLTLE